MRCFTVVVLLLSASAVLSSDSDSSSEIDPEVLDLFHSPRPLKQASMTLLANESVASGPDYSTAKGSVLTPQIIVGLIYLASLVGGVFYISRRHQDEKKVTHKMEFITFGIFSLELPVLFLTVAYFGNIASDGNISEYSVIFSAAALNMFLSIRSWILLSKTMYALLYESATHPFAKFMLESEECWVAALGFVLPWWAGSQGYYGADYYSDVFGYYMLDPSNPSDQLWR